MKVLVSWLRELVDVSAGAEDLGQRLHLAGFELAGIEPVDQDDRLIDLEITANRPDCLSMVGIAREVAALYDVPLSCAPAGFAEGGHASTSGALRVTIEDDELCPRYTAALADVSVGPSPAWLANRLAAAGIRSLNNIVDLTNYVLLETGHPLHAFDLATLAGPHLRIRRAAPGETVKTLDGQTRALAPEMLVIADEARPQAVAGVMGGSDSEVTAATKTIVLESAYFQPASIRRTSKRLGLSTEASYRFERGADPEAAPRALARACQLLVDIGAGTMQGTWIDAVAKPHEPVSVELRHARVRRVLGFDVEPASIVTLLTALGFEPVDSPAAPQPGVRSPEPRSPTVSREPGTARPAPAAWSVGVPSWRVDVAREIDLIEEVARIRGYAQIPTTFPALTLAPPDPDARLARDARLRSVARGMGFSESVTFSFIDRESAERFADAGSLVTIANPLSENFAVMRPSLLPGLVTSVAHNRRREQRDVRLFELANRFTRDRGEHRALAFAWTGDASPLHWSGTGRAVDAYDLAGVVATVADVLHLGVTLVPAALPSFVDASACAIEARPPEGTSTAPRVVGAFGQLAPALAEKAGIPAREPVFLAEIDLDAVLDWTGSVARLQVKPLPRFPSSTRDLSILMPLGLPAADIRGTIREAAPRSLVRVQEFDRYQGRGVPDGSCSLSLRLTFRAADRTLTEAEVQTAVDAVVAKLSARHGATLR